MVSCGQPVKIAARPWAQPVENAGAFSTACTHFFTACPQETRARAEQDLSMRSALNNNKFSIFVFYFLKWGRCPQTPLGLQHGEGGRKSNNQNRLAACFTAGGEGTERSGVIPSDNHSRLSDHPYSPLGFPLQLIRKSAPVLQTWGEREA